MLTCGLLLILSLLKLFFESVESHVDSLLEGIGCLVGNKLIELRHCQAYDSLLVESCLGLHNLELYVYSTHCREAAHNAIDLFVDKGCKLLGDVKMDSFNVNVHSVLLC